jgi:hypothetical protein
MAGVLTVLILNKDCIIRSSITHCEGLSNFNKLNNDYKQLNKEEGKL